MSALPGDDFSYYGEPGSVPPRVERWEGDFADYIKRFYDNAMPAPAEVTPADKAMLAALGISWCA